MFKANKTLQWLHEKSEEERSDLIKAAAAQSKKLREEDRNFTEDHQAKLKERLKKLREDR